MTREKEQGSATGARSAWASAIAAALAHIIVRAKATVDASVGSMSDRLKQDRRLFTVVPDRSQDLLCFALQCHLCIDIAALGAFEYLQEFVHTLRADHN
jgi:hypothetical protein